MHQASSKTIKENKIVMKNHRESGLEWDYDWGREDKQDVHNAIFLYQGEGSGSVAL